MSQPIRLTPFVAPKPKARSEFAREEMPAPFDPDQPKPRPPAFDLQRFEREGAQVRAFSFEQHLVTPYRIRLTPETVQKANIALRQYKAKYPASPEFPWRMARSPITRLPAYLRGNLPNGSPLDARAQKYFQSEYLAPALFGKSFDLKDFTPEPQVITLAYSHVRYRQALHNLPVLGGAVTVHLDDTGPHISCTSSFLPISPAQAEILAPDANTLSPEMAIQVARKVIQHYLNPRTAARPDLTALGRARRRSLETPRLAANVFARADQSGWHAVIHETMPGKLLLIMPFAGDYHLAYQVRLTADDEDKIWNVFVDAQTGEALGRPLALAYFAFHYPSSASLLANEPPTHIALQNDPCQDFLVVAENTPTSWWQSEARDGEAFLRANIAIHAGDMYAHFVKLCKPANALADAVARKHKLILELETDKTRRPQFNPWAGTLTFAQALQGAPLDPDAPVPDPGATSPPIHAPAIDPEVIYHEVAHGLMWLLNADPFQNVLRDAPYMCALTEGYALYYARSLGASATQEPDTAPTLWARAAYRADDWKAKWAFGRDETSADLLITHPNVYAALAEGLPVYDLGMVWARALWDLRRIVGAEIADRLALNAFLHAQGWVTNFESTAEGLLEASQRASGGDRIFWNNVLLPLLANRNIIAQRGVQTLAAAQHTLLVGTDAGITFSTNDGGSWCRENPASALSEVIALAHAPTPQGETWFAATETGIYRRDATDPNWKPYTGWTFPGRPLAILFHADFLFVSAGQSVWLIHKNAPLDGAWQKKYSADDDLALDLAATGNDLFDVMIARSRSLVHLRKTNTPLSPPAIANEGVILTLATSGARVFIGTDNRGVCECLKYANPAHVDWKSLGLEDVAVLSLAVQATAPLTLYAGTSAGVFVGVENAAGEIVWRHWVGLPADVVITKILIAATGVYAGTAQHGLWFRTDEAATWEPSISVNDLFGGTTQRLGGTNTTWTFNLEPNVELAFYPFELTETRTITIAPLDPRIELWWLRPNIQKQIAPCQHATPGFYAVVVRGAIQPTITVTVSVS